MISLHAHNGIQIQHTRDIKLRIAIDLQSLMVVSDSQSTKHRVTLFHYVVPACYLDFLVRNCNQAVCLQN